MGNADILVVEDEGYLRDYVSALLRSSGHTVASVASGAEACDLVEAGLRPDLLFTDIYLVSSMDGIELAERIRVLLPTIALLFVSGDPGICERVSLPKGGQFLPKPFRRVQCHDAVKRALEEA